MWREYPIIFITIYVELKKPVETAVALNNKRGVIWGVECRMLGAMVFIIERNVILRCICRDYNVITF